MNLWGYAYRYGGLPARREGVAGQAVRGDVEAARVEWVKQIPGAALPGRLYTSSTAGLLGLWKMVTATPDLIALTC